MIAAAPHEAQVITADEASLTRTACWWSMPRCNVHSVTRATVTAPLLCVVAATTSLAQAPAARDTAMRLDEVITATLRYSPVIAQAAGAVRIGLSGQRVALGTFIPLATFAATALNSNQVLATAGSSLETNASHTNSYSSSGLPSHLSPRARSTRFSDRASWSTLRAQPLPTPSGPFSTPPRWSGPARPRAPICFKLNTI